jgi:hypothetical protein
MRKLILSVWLTVVVALSIGPALAGPIGPTP